MVRKNSWMSDGEGGRCLTLRLPCPQGASVMEACGVAEREIVRNRRTFVLRKVVRRNGGWWALYGLAPKHWNGRCRREAEEEE